MKIKFSLNPVKGITLIEIVIAVGILTIGIFGILRVFPPSIATNHYLDLSAGAQTVAQDEIEYLNSLSYNEIATGTIENNVHVTSDISSPLYIFTRTTTAGLVDQNLTPTAIDIGLKQINITAFWPSFFNAGPGSSTIIFLISKR